MVFVCVCVCDLAPPSHGGAAARPPPLAAGAVPSARRRPGRSPWAPGRAACSRLRAPPRCAAVAVKRGDDGVGACRLARSVGRWVVRGVGYHSWRGAPNKGPGFLRRITHYGMTSPAGAVEAPARRRAGARRSPAAPLAVCGCRPPRDSSLAVPRGVASVVELLQVSATIAVSRAGFSAGSWPISARTPLNGAPVVLTAAADALCPPGPGCPPRVPAPDRAGCGRGSQAESLRCARPRPSNVLLPFHGLDLAGVLGCQGARTAGGLPPPPRCGRQEVALVLLKLLTDCCLGTLAAKSVVLPPSDVHALGSRRPSRPPRARSAQLQCAAAKRLPRPRMRLPRGCPPVVAGASRAPAVGRPAAKEAARQRRWVWGLELECPAPSAPGLHAAAKRPPRARALMMRGRPSVGASPSRALAATRTPAIGAVL